MKKILILPLLLILLISCGSDDKEDNDKNNVNGTIWICEDICKLSFISNDECHLFINSYQLNENDYYNYKFNDSNIEIYQAGNFVIYKLEFQANGNLAVIDADFGYYLFELKKK